MSRSRGVRATARPYFAMVSPDSITAAQLPAGGVYVLDVEFAVQAMPVGESSEDELHSLFSIIDYFSNPLKNLLRIGITPNGRLKADNLFGDSVQSQPGVITANDVRRTARVFYDAGGQISVELIGENLNWGNVATPGALLPSKYARAMAFNDVTGLSRIACTIYNASATWDAIAAYSDSPVFSYAFDEHQGGIVAAEYFTSPVATGGGFWANSTIPVEAWTLETTFWDPLYGTHYWGDVPVQSPSALSAFAWEVDTHYTKRAIPNTEYRRAV